MNVVKLEDHRKKELVDALSGLVRLAENGQISGIAFVVKVGPSDNRAGLAGEYRRHPERALKAALMLGRHLADGDEPTMGFALK